MKFNTNLAIALVALAVVGISFASSANTGFGVINSYGVEINPANVACADSDKLCKNGVCVVV